MLLDVCINQNESRRDGYKNWQLCHKICHNYLLIYL